MLEYYKCKNCGQVVEGFQAACLAWCCLHPDHRQLSGDLVVTEQIADARTEEVIAVEGRVLSTGQISRILHDHPRADIREA